MSPLVPPTQQYTVHKLNLMKLFARNHVHSKFVIFDREMEPLKSGQLISFRLSDVYVTCFIKGKRLRLEYEMFE